MSIIAMCDKATSLCVSEKQALKALCLRYSSVFNTGDKPFAVTNLTTFPINFTKTMDVPISYALRPTSPPAARIQ